MYIVRLLNTILVLVKYWYFGRTFHQPSTGDNVDGWWKVQPKYQYFAKSKTAFNNLKICISF